MKRSETRGLTSKVRLPKDRYAIQCVEESVETSKAGSIMIVSKWQIVAGPDGTGIMTIDGNDYDIAGTNLRPMYQTTKVKKGDTWDDEKTQSACDRFVDFLFKTGQVEDASSFEFDESNPPLLMKGKVIDCILSSEEYMQRKSPTLEQAKKNEPGDPITDDNGKPVVGYNTNIGEILGLSRVEPMPY